MRNVFWAEVCDHLGNKGKFYIVATDREGALLCAEARGDLLSLDLVECLQATDAETGESVKVGLVVPDEPLSSFEPDRFTPPWAMRWAMNRDGVAFYYEFRPNRDMKRGKWTKFEGRMEQDRRKYDGVAWGNSLCKVNRSDGK